MTLLNPDAYANNILTNNFSSIAKVPVIYGSRRVGGTVVFMQVNYKDLYLVVVLCEGPISAINTVYLDDVAVTDSRYTSSSPNLVHVYKHTGTTTQAADSTLSAMFGGSPYLWTSAHQLKGLAYIVVKLTYDSDTFSNLPTITADVDGKLITDIRTSPHSQVFSSNPALCIRDYLTNTIYGKGLDSSLIDDSLIATAANTCDTQIAETTASPATYIDKFSCNTVVDTENTIKDNLDVLLLSCRGHLSYYGGTYNLNIEQDASSVYSFDTDNIIDSINVTSGGKQDKLNRIKVTYIDPNQNYKNATYVYDSTALRTEDNNVILEKEISLPFETNQYRAQWHAYFLVKRSRLQIKCNFTASPEAIKCVPGDIVDVTYSPLGWSSKKFRVLGLKARIDCLVDISLIEHDSAIYDRTVPSAVSSISETDLPNPFTVIAPTNLSLASGTDYLLKASDGTIFSRIYVTWTATTDMFLHHYEIRWKITGSSYAGMVTAKKDSTSAYIDGVKDGADYTVEVYTVNSLGVYSSALSDTHTVIGKTAAPNPGSALASSSVPTGIKWTWTNCSDADLNEVYLYVSDTDDRTTASVIKVGRVDSYTQIVAAGVTQYAWIYMIDTSGNPSAAYPTSPTGGVSGTSGAVATSDLSGTIDWSTQVTDSNSPSAKPVDYADVTQDALDAGITTTGFIILSTGGNARSGKSSYADTSSGWWLGNDSGTPKFKIGNSTHVFSWDGSTLTLQGSFQTASTGQRIVLDSSNNDLQFYTGDSPETLAASISVGGGGFNTIGYFYNDTQTALVGKTESGTAIEGLGNTSGTGVYGVSASGYGVEAEDVSTGYALGIAGQQGHVKFEGAINHSNAHGASGHLFYDENEELNFHHNGGWGQIPTTNSDSSYGSQTITNGSTWRPSAGFYVCDVTGGPPTLQVWNGSAWSTGGNYYGGLMWFDGSNMRLYNVSGGTSTVYYRKMTSAFG